MKIHIMTHPEAGKRDTDEVQCQLAKEIQLQHRAPVLSVAVVDGKDIPIHAQVGFEDAPNRRSGSLNPVGRGSE